MKTKSEQNKEQAILQAAEREFLTKGYDGARTVSIAEAAGVTHAMLHYYYRTKAQLFKKILDEKVSLMSRSFIAAFGEPGLPLSERLKKGIECHFDFIAANPDLPRFILNEVFARPERYETMRESIQNAVRFLIREVQREIDASAERGEIEWIDIRMLLLDVISLNVFPFISFPVVEPILGDLTANRECFFEMRKQETIETIMRRIKKCEP